METAVYLTEDEAQCFLDFRKNRDFYELCFSHRRLLEKTFNLKNGSVEIHFKNGEMKKVHFHTWESAKNKDILKLSTG